MALTTEQKTLGTAIATLVGTTLHIVPNQTQIQEYLDYISAEIATVAKTQAGANVVKDETEAVLGVLNAVADVLPDGAKGKKNYKGAVTFITGIAHMFGL